MRFRQTARAYGQNSLTSQFSASLMRVPDCTCTRSGFGIGPECSAGLLRRSIGSSTLVPPRGVVDHHKRLPLLASCLSAHGRQGTRRAVVAVSSRLATSERVTCGHGVPLGFHWSPDRADPFRASTRGQRLTRPPSRSGDRRDHGRSHRVPTALVTAPSGLRAVAMTSRRGAVTTNALSLAGLWSVEHPAVISTTIAKTTTTPTTRRMPMMRALAGCQSAKLATTLPPSLGATLTSRSTLPRVASITSV